jgi:hypothetical protein
MYAFQSPSLSSPVQRTSSNLFSYPSRRFKAQSEKIAIFFRFSKHFLACGFRKESNTDKNFEIV